MGGPHFLFFVSTIDGKEYKDFLLNPLDGSVKLNRTLVDNELVQPVTLVVKVMDSTF